MDGYSLDKRWIHKGGYVIYGTISVKCSRRPGRFSRLLRCAVTKILRAKTAEEGLRRGA